MAEPARGQCAICDRVFTLRRDGTMRAHGRLEGGPGECAGSWEPPREDKVTMAEPELPSERRMWVECDKGQAQLRIRVFDADTVPDDVWIKRVPFDEAKQRMEDYWRKSICESDDEFFDGALRAALGEGS